MKYKIVCLFALITHCCIFAGLENFKANIHEDVVDIAKIVWKWNNPFVAVGLQREQIEQQMPCWLSQSGGNLAQATQYVGVSGLLFFLPIFMEFGRPTFVHWLSKLKKSEVPPAPISDNEENGDNEINERCKPKTQKNDLFNKQVVFYQIDGEPLITSDTILMPIYAGIGKSITHMRFEQNNNRTKSQVAFMTIGYAGCAGLADVTYNTAMLILKKIFTKLEIQNPFDTQAWWYRTVQRYGSSMVKTVLVFIYQNQVASLLNSTKNN